MEKMHREGHFDVQSRTPSGIHIDQYWPSIFQRFARYARSRLARNSMLPTSGSRHINRKWRHDDRKLPECDRKWWAIIGKHRKWRHIALKRSQINRTWRHYDRKGPESDRKCWAIIGKHRKWRHIALERSQINRKWRHYDRKWPGSDRKWWAIIWKHRK